MTTATLETPVVVRPPSVDDDPERYEIIDGARGVTADECLRIKGRDSIGHPDRCVR